MFDPTRYAPRNLNGTVSSHVLLEGAVRSALQAVLQSEADCEMAACNNMSINGASKRCILTVNYNDNQYAQPKNMICTSYGAR